MEWLEQQAIATAPVNCRPRLWKRFVDDTLEVIKRGSVTQLTEHLNSVDSTGSIRFTYEEETEGQIPFLDTLLIRKEDGNVKLLLYRKKTHTSTSMQLTLDIMMQICNLFSGASPFSNRQKWEGHCPLSQSWGHVPLLPPASRASGKGLVWEYG